MRAPIFASLRPSRSILALAALLAIPLSARIASAQALVLPQVSPHARVEQRVGITDLSVDYSSPGVKGRKVWGDLVPYDKVWRAGANAATKLTSTHDFTFGGTPIKAGTYSIFITPGKAQWTVILNNDPRMGAPDHDPKKDVASVTVKPVALAAPRERLTYLFSDTQDDRTSLDLEWERVRIRVPITVDTKALVMAAVEKAVEGAWRPLWSAAGYYLGTGDYDRGLALIDKSIGIQSTWRNEWVRAQLLGKKGKKAEATAAASRALTLGASDPTFEQFVKSDVVKAMAGWK